MQAGNIVARVKNILLTPRAEWPVIAAEPETIGGLYTGYIMILAAIPALRLLLSLAAIGTSTPFGPTYRIGVGAALSTAVTTYVLTLAGTFLVALIVEALAPTFGGQKDRVQALKVVAYAYTASWIASLIGIVPGLGLLSALAGLVYGLYLLWLGLPYTMKCPEDKAVGYTVVTVLVAIVVSFILGLAVRAVGGFGAFGGPGMGMSMPASGGIGAAALGSAAIASRSAPGGAAGAVNDYAARMDAASKQLDSAQKSGDQAAKADALQQFMGAAFGSGGKVESLPPDQIKGFLPEEIDGMKRTSQQVQRNGAIGVQISTATATYSDGAGRTLNLEITDAGSMKGLVGMAAGWAGVEQESQTDTGYDKTYRTSGGMVHEQWDTRSHSGEYSTFIADRFAVKVTGQGADIGDLKRVVTHIDTGGLAALKNYGVTAAAN